MAANKGAPWHARALDDLRSSGLDPAALAKLGAALPATPQQIGALLGCDAMQLEAATLLTYYSIAKTGALTPLKHSDYCRAKLYYKPLTGFAATTGVDDRPKYLQRAGTGIRLYVPPVLDWSRFIETSSTELIITEGEKKALAAARRGLWCVALGGVNSIANRKVDELLIPELEWLTHARNVLIVFDVDKGYTCLKPQVARAATVLSQRLTNYAGAYPGVTTLYSDGTRKVALDDWLLTHSGADAEALMVQLRASTLRESAATMLHEENERHVYIRSLDAVASLDHSRHLSPVGAYRNARNNAQCVVSEIIVDKEGAQATRAAPKRRAQAWLEWSGRNSVDKADYLPGEHGYLVNGVFNTWRGWAQPPQPKARLRDIERFVTALKYLHGDECWGYMLDWYCYPLAYPGGKLFTIPVLQSEFEGIGKSLVPTMVGKYIYGFGINGSPGNAWILNASTVEKEGGRLEYASESQFILMDDVQDMTRMLELLNALATQDTLSVNEKYVRSRRVRNCMNVILTTNRTNPVRITENNRRLYYPHINIQKNEPLWRGLVDWFVAGGGGALLGYAQGEWMSNRGKTFDPMAPAPMTDKKEEMVEYSSSAMDDWARSLVARADRLNRPVATGPELRALMLAECNADDRDPEYSNRVRFGRALRLAGVVPLDHCRRVKVNGVVTTVYGVGGSAAKWARAQHSQVLDALHRWPVLRMARQPAGTPPVITAVGAPSPAKRRGRGT